MKISTTLSILRIKIRNTIKFSAILILIKIYSKNITKPVELKQIIQSTHIPDAHL